MVTVRSVEDRQKLESCLKHGKDNIGRFLSKKVPSLGLLRCDRLMPSFDMPDIFALRQMAVPFKATFWRSPSGSVKELRWAGFLFVSQGVTVGKKRLGVSIEVASVKLWPGKMGGEGGARCGEL